MKVCIPDKVKVTWAWLESDLNGADIASRVDAGPRDLGPGSDWQDGPAFLQDAIESWPIRTDIMDDKLDLPTAHEETQKAIQAPPGVPHPAQDVQPHPEVDRLPDQLLEGGPCKDQLPLQMAGQV